MMSGLLPVIDSGIPTGICQPFSERIARDGEPLSRGSVSVVQVNMGKLCNQTCTHCHVEAGPTKTRENMDGPTANRIVDLALDCDSLETVDLTGGAPELNPHFRSVVKQLRGKDLEVIDRCNLTILSEPGHEDLGAFLAEHQVTVIASLPCYLSENVDKQRGRGVFGRSIDGLLALNALGYGDPATGLKLDLVFNPIGPTLPPKQEPLEAEYKRELLDRFGIRFNRLLTITNMPIKRYGKQLSRAGQLKDYMDLLVGHFNFQAVHNVMCRSLISIGWDGSIYDCDFNQMLEISAGGGPLQNVSEIQSFDQFVNRPIATADHCYGCTAGCGSSCTGSVA